MSVWRPVLLTEHLFLEMSPPCNFLITEVLDRSYLSYSFLQTHFTQFQLLLLFVFQQQLLLCRLYYKCLTPWSVPTHCSVGDSSETGQQIQLAEGNKEGSAAH